MEYLLIPLLGFLAASKSVVQSRFAKGHTKTTANGVFFVAFVFLTCALLTIPSLFQGSVNGKFLLLIYLYCHNSDRGFALFFFLNTSLSCWKVPLKITSLNTSNHRGNVSQTHNETAPHTCQNVCYQNNNKEEVK